MVAIVSSNNLGLSNNTLGQSGVFGSAQNGRSGEQVIVNAASGNLILQDRDDVLAGLGQDIAAVRTYNSQGLLIDNQRQNWLSGFYQQAISVNGSLNQPGSSLIRTERDGAQSLFAFDSSKGLYVSTDGDGAYNTISYNTSSNNNSGGYHFIEAASRNSVDYDANGRLQQSSDASGNLTRYNYNPNGSLASVVDGSGVNTDTLFYDYDNNQRLSAVRSESRQNGVTSSLSRVHYGYNANGQLDTVTVDLSPADSDITDGKTYITHYTYFDGSNNLKQITQSDGSSLSFTYVNVNGQSRIATVTDALNQITRFDYDTVNNLTRVTDPLNLVTTYQYDSRGQLLQLRAPAVNGQAQVTTYHYNARGDLDSMQDAEGRTITYTIDSASGDQTGQQDSLGNTISRRYINSQLVSETHYTIPASGNLPASGALTTLYVRDDKDRLRFMISPENRVTEYRYDALGQRVASLTYGRAFDAALIQQDPVSHQTDFAATLKKAASWVTIQDASLIQRTDYNYDVHGQLQTSTVYANLDAQGNGIKDSETSITRYVFSQAGELLQTIAPDNGSTVYSYDGLGRQTSSQTVVNGLQQSTLTRYDDAGQKTSVTLANGLVTTSVYDSAGRLTTLLQKDAQDKVLSQTRYVYDAGNRLIQSSDATGVTQWVLYDDAGRRAASIDALGAVTEYSYNNANQLIRSTVRANLLSPALLSAITANPQLARPGGANESAAGASMIDVSVAASTTGDRISRQIYDAAGRLLKTIDALGAVVTNQYDGANRLISSTASANLLTATQIAALAAKDAANTPISAQDASTTPVADAANDRTTRRFYDKDGLLRGVLDADFYLTEYQYNANGEAALTHRYGKQITNYVAGATLARITPGYTSDDIRNVTLYNAKGQVAAQIDGLHYLTRLTYDLNGNLASSQRFATHLSDTDLVQISTPLTSALLQVASSASDQITRNQYDNLNRLISSTNAEGTVTTYQYDAVGNLLTSVSDRVTPENGGVRGNDRHFDLQGRLIVELSGEGSRLLHSGSHTQAEIDALWRQYAVRYTYDAAGRRTSSLDQDQHTTLYFYDADGRLQTTVNAAGEVTRLDYTVQGELKTRTGYATRIDAASLLALQQSTLQGSTPRLQPVVSIDAANDRIDSYTYDVRGQLINQSDAIGSNLRTSYNAFGETATRTQTIIKALDKSTTTTRYAYNKRGLLYTTLADEGGFNYLGNYTNYDAFGRQIRFQDMGGNVRTTSYDALGRVVTVTDPLQKNTTTWDAFDRVLTSTDGLNQTTRYTYDLATRSMTVTSPEGVKLTTTHNAYGQKDSVTDGNGNVTHFQYDGNGQLLSSSDSIGNTLNHYDHAGLLTFSVDAKGSITTFDYDAANRVFTRTVDPAQRPDGAPPAPAGSTAHTPLALTTRYTFDAFGEAIYVTDPKGIVSKTEYDQKGQIKTVTQDYGTGSNFLNLKTSFTYDLRGNTISVTDANNHVTSYVFDSLGRRASMAVVADGVTQTTRYAYDRNNNLLQVIDPNGNRTRRIYDAQNRVTDVIDAAGGVTHTEYDGAGRVITQTAYANAIDLAPVAALTGALTTSFVASLLHPDSDIDNVLHTIYNKDGQVRFTVDGEGFVSERNYDHNGNLMRSAEYRSRCRAAYTESSLAAFVQSVDEFPNVTRYVYDARNRLVYQLDPRRDAITQQIYDANDNVIQRIGWARGSSAGDWPSDHVVTIADIKDTLKYDLNIDGGDGPYNRETPPTDLENHNQILQYDAANRLIASATLATSTLGGGVHWLVETRQLDAVGNVIASSRFDHTSASLERTQLDAATIDATLTDFVANTPRNYASDNNRVNVYDSANRLLASATAQGVNAAGLLQWAIVSNRYDAAGNVLERTAFATALSSQPGVPLNSSDIRTWIAAQNPAAPQNNRTRYLYDSANRLIFTIDAVGAVTQNVYDANGNVLTQVMFEQKVDAASYTVTDLQNKLRPATQPWSAWASWVNNGKNHLTSNVYDANNRLVYQIDTLGDLTERQYDALGNLVQTRAYATPLAAPLLTSRPTLATMRSAAATIASSDDRITRQRFDTNNRLTYQIDALGYVTQTLYTAFGQVQTVRRYTAPVPAITSATPLAQLQSMLGSINSFSDNYDYDSAGNMLSHQDANYHRTTYEYDALNRRISMTQSNGFDNLTWTYAYDSMDRQIREVSPAVSVEDGGWDIDPVTQKTAYFSHTSDNVYAITRNTYDVLGNLISRSESAGEVDGHAATGVPHYHERDVRTTRYEYDAGGHQLKTILPATLVWDATSDPGGLNPVQILVNPTTTVTYDTLGRAIVNEDAGGTYISLGANQPGIRLGHGNFSYKTWDALGRVEYEVDALGLVTGYDYDSFGAVKTLTRYAFAPALTATTPLPAGTLPVIQLHALLLGAIADRTALNDWAAQYAQAGSVAELANRLIAASPQQYPAGMSDRDFILKLYATGLNRVPVDTDITYWLNALHAPGSSRGTVAASFLNVASANNSDSATFNAKVSALLAPFNAMASGLTSAAIKTALAAQTLDQTSQNRAITTEYDLLGREIKRTEPLAMLNDARHTGTTQSISAAKTTATRYNAFGQATRVATYGVAQGQIVTQIDNAYVWYDARGNKAAQFMVVANDGAEVGYLTTFGYDDAGNLTAQTGYATAMTLSAAAQNGAPPTPPAASDDDRQTVWEYDGNHRKISETRINVAYAVDGDDIATALTRRGDLQTTYRYDIFGNLAATIDSLGRTTVTTYNALGFITAVLTNATDQYQTAPLTLFKRDIHGDLIQKIEVANGGQFIFIDEVNAYRINSNAPDDAQDRVTSSAFDSAGHVIQVLDAEQHLAQMAYDVFGHAVLQTQQVSNAVFGTSENRFEVLQYDALGRLVDDATRDVSDVLSTTRTLQVAHQHTGYNGFGELIDKQFKLTSGVNGAVIGTVNTYELDQYDNAGHLVVSNQGDGVMHLMQNDLEGRVTSSTRIGNNGALVDKTVYDLAGNVQSTTSSFGSTITQMVDRWGNVISRSDPRNAGWTTFFSYNANNRLIKTVAPVVDTGSGAVIDQITTATAYDVAGRDVLSVDGNGYSNTKTWDSNDQLAQEKHADGGTVTHTYNLFGNQILLKVDLDANHYRLTGFTYDKLGQLASTVRAKTDDTHTGVRVFTTHASAGDGSNVILDDLGLHQLVEKYAYDELGRRIQTTTTTDASNPLVPDESTSTQYDLEGNIIRTRDLTGADTWRAWDDFHHKITEIDANGNARNWTYSVTGRMLTSTSLAAQYDTPVTTTYTYDDAGLLRSQTSNNPVAALAQNLTYDTYQGTVLRGMLDHSTGQSTLYEYDAAGNRTHEQTINRDHFTLQDNHLVFNAQNQIVSIQNDIADTTGPNTGVHFALHYDYDHNGNRIHAVTDYLDNKGQSHHADTFNTYDTQNRALIVNSLTAGDITYDVAANNTHQLTYNWAGERTSDTYLGKHLEASPQPENLPDTPAPGPFDKIRVSDDTLGTTTETYRYDEAGRLTDTFRDEQVSIDANESLRVRVDTHSYDLAGRVVLNGPSQDSSLFLNGLGVNSLARFSIYEHGRRIREKAKDVADGLKELDDTYFDGASYDRVGNVLKYTVVSHGRGKTIYTTDFNKLDTYVEGTSTATGINGDGNYVSSATTTSTYDANGNRVSVTDNKYDGTTGIRTLQYDAQGHVLAKYQDGKLTRSLIVNGELLGSTDPDSVGDLANPYSAVTGSAIDNSPGYYTVQNEGETWQSIAKAAWGDSKLWYQIADANGGVAGLHPGQIIKLPAKPSTIDNDAHTFKPYDASKLVGSTTANVPTPAGAAPCGGAGQIIVTVVAIVVAAVVTALTRDPEAGITVYSAIAGAAAGNVAGQVVGNLIGVQSGFNFKSFALSIVSAAVSPGGIPEGQSLWTTAANAAIANATTQAIGVVTHLQKSFDWRGVVASGVGAAIGQEVGEALNSNKAFADLGKTGGQFARGFATSFVAGTATALAHGGKVSVVQVAADAFGNSLGESIASTLQPQKTNWFAGMKFGSYGQTSTESSSSPWSLSAGGTAKFSGYIDNTPISTDGNNAAYSIVPGDITYPFPANVKYIISPDQLSETIKYARDKGFNGTAIKNPDGSVYQNKDGTIIIRGGTDGTAGPHNTGDPIGYYNPSAIPDGATDIHPITITRADGTVNGGWSYTQNGIVNNAILYPPIQENSTPVVVNTPINILSPAAQSPSPTGLITDLDMLKFYAANPNLILGPQMKPYDPAQIVSAANQEKREAQRLGNTFVTPMLGPFGLPGMVQRWSGVSEDKIAETNEVGAAAAGAVGSFAGIPTSRPLTLAPKVGPDYYSVPGADAPRSQTGAYSPKQTTYTNTGKSVPTYNAGNLGLSPSAPGANTSVYPEGLTFDIKIPSHLNGPDGFSQKSGISGTHNLNEFMQVAAQNNVRIVGQTPGATPGIFNIDYQIPSLNSAGGVAMNAGGSPIFKNQLFTKTVYDPNVFSTSSILEFGQQAATRGYEGAITTGAKAYNSEAGGIPFRIYVDPKTGLITNFHPR